MYIKRQRLRLLAASFMCHFGLLYQIYKCLNGCNISIQWLGEGHAAAGRALLAATRVKLLASLCIFNKVNLASNLL